MSVIYNTPCFLNIHSSDALGYPKEVAIDMLNGEKSVIDISAHKYNTIKGKPGDLFACIATIEHFKIDNESKIEIGDLTVRYVESPDTKSSKLVASPQPLNENFILSLISELKDNLPTNHQAIIFFGDDAVADFKANGINGKEILNNYEEYFFQSHQERNAFINGCKAVSGSDDYLVLEDPMELKKFREILSSSVKEKTTKAKKASLK